MAEAPEYEKMWARQIAEVVGNQDALRVIQLARINGLFDPNKQTERLRSALLFYADRKNYQQRGWQGDPDPALVLVDCGEKARDAIEIICEQEGKSP